MVVVSDDRSKNVCGSKYKVKFDTRTVRQFVLPVLRRVDVGDYPAKIGRIVGLSRQHVRYYLEKLERAKLIRKGSRSSTVVYEITELGKNLVGSCDGVVFPSEVHRLDKCQVAFEVRREGSVPEDFRRVEMQNWTALLGLEQGVKVRKTTKNWIVHVEVIRGKNPGEVYGLALNLASRVALALSRKYGCVLSEGKFIAGELAVEDPVACLFGRYFTVRTDRRKVDHSWGPGELEHLQKDAVIEYLQMPERVKKLEGEVEAARIDLTVINGNLQKLTETLSRLFEMEGQNSKPVVNGGEKDYVS